jgi:Allene oxide cyclase barrel like domain
MAVARRSRSMGEERAKAGAMHFKVLLVVVAFLGVGFAAAMFHEASASGTPVAQASLRFDIEFHDTILAQATSRFSLGDRFILHDRVLLNGRQVGHNSGVCTVTDVAGETICIVTWALPEGTISTQLLNSPPPRKAFAVVGGTGRYLGVRGAGELVEAGNETGTVTFSLVG